MSNSPEKNNRSQFEWKHLIWYLLIGLMVLSIVTTYFKEPKAAKSVAFSEFLNEIDRGNISEVTIKPGEKLVLASTKAGSKVKTYFIEYPEFIKEMRVKNISIKVDSAESGFSWSILLQAFLPFILIGLLWFFIFRQAQGANNQAMSFGKSRAVPWKKDDKNKVTTFKDVAGIDEALDELKEIVDFLKNPSKYIAIGAKIPRGVLLMGSPGTGKTLLARAIAGEADVPFFSLSGSDFVEMFVGVGASRVRDLYAQAKKAQPCIIFLDEIDAVGRQRGAGLGGGHDEREQTLNQLLVEMDGFDSKTTVIVIAATNRPDILDPALLRPGRFDRQIVVDKPDVKGRLEILKIHSQGKKIDQDINLEVIAKRTPGFSGADLSNLLNEAALLSARYDKKQIGMKEIEEATDRIIAGPERKSRVMTKKEKEIIAYHEMGHAIVALCVPNTDPVHKISILPRGMALGYTLQLPEKDTLLLSKSQIESQIKILMGGRIAEDLIFGEITSGASNDIERATDLARSYICSYGMSTKLGTRKYGKASHQVFLGRDYSDHSKDYAEATAKEIDDEIRQLIDICYQESTQILKEHKAKLKFLSELLIEKEVIEGSEFKELFQKSSVDTVDILVSG